MTTKDADEVNVVQNQNSSSSQLSVDVNICKWLSDEWKKTCKKESRLIKARRLARFNLWDEEVKGRKAFLKSWKPAPTKAELEEKYSQSEIDEAEKVLREKQALLEISKQGCEDELKEIKGDVAKQRETIGEKEKTLKGLLDKLKALPGQINKAQDEVDQLAKAKEEAEETWSQDLIDADLQLAKKKVKHLRKLLSEDKPLNSAVTKAYQAWRDEREILENMIVDDVSKKEEQKKQRKDGKDKHTQEEIEIQIAEIESQLEYLKERWNALVEKHYEVTEGS